MNPLKERLLQSLASIEGLAVEPSPVSGGTALVFKGKEFAHFHNDQELDLRLTKKIIHSLGLSHPAGSAHHPTRSSSSPWIEVRFTSLDDVGRIADLVKIAIEQL